MEGAHDSAASWSYKYFRFRVGNPTDSERSLVHVESTDLSEARPAASALLDVLEDIGAGRIMLTIFDWIRKYKDSASLSHNKSRWSSDS